MRVLTFKSSTLILALLLCHGLVKGDISKDILTPFVGINIGNYKVFFEPGYGQKMFRKDAGFYNLCAGIKMNNFIGIEIGYQHDNKRKKLQEVNSYPGGQLFLPGIRDDTYFKTHLNIKHTYLGLTLNNALTNKIDISFLIGGSLATISASHNIWALWGSKIEGENAEKLIAKRTYKKHKLVTMFSARIEYKMSERFTFRTSASYFKLSRISINSRENGRLRPDGLPVAPYANIKIRSPISYAVGICVNF